MTKFLLLFVSVFLVTGTAFTQDTEDTAPTAYRSLLVYLDSFTGQLNTDSDPLFTGNEFEFGVSYSQNFATVPWLSMWVKALVVTGTTPAYNQEGTFLGNSGYSIQSYGMPRAQVGVNLGGYAVFAMDTRGLLANELYYTLRLGAGGNITFQSILELFAVPQVVSNNQITVVDLFEIRLNYEIGFAPGWTYRSKLGFRLGSGGYDYADHATYPVDSSAERFGNSFHMRWENQVVWALTPSFFMWTQLRYQAKHIVYREQAIQHDVFLQAGLGYSFDLSDR